MFVIFDKFVFFPTITKNVLEKGRKKRSFL